MKTGNHGLGFGVQLVCVMLMTMAQSAFSWPSSWASIENTNLGYLNIGDTKTQSNITLNWSSQYSQGAEQCFSVTVQPNSITDIEVKCDGVSGILHTEATPYNLGFTDQSVLLSSSSSWTKIGSIVSTGLNVITVNMYYESFLSGNTVTHAHLRLTSRQSSNGSDGGGSGGDAKYALCVGLNKYDMTSWNNQGWLLTVLNGCVNDATYFRDNLINRGGWLSANITKLVDSAATKAAIRNAIQSYAAKAVSGDTFIYIHSSHALNHEDYSGNYTKNVALAAYAGPYEDYELASDLASFASGVKVVVIVDACHSGGLFKSTGEAQSFDLAKRVSMLVDQLREEKNAKGENDYGSKITASGIGWVTAAEYNETSKDGGCYDSSAWLTDWSKRWFNVGGVCGGAFDGAFIWGWWNGLADTTGVGDNDGLMDAYEGYKYAYSIMTSLGLSTPQYLNDSVLRSVELGTSGGSTPSISAPTAPKISIPTFGSNANASSITVSWSGGSGATSYNLYRSTSSSRPSSAYKTNVTSPYVDSDSSLTPGVKYYYWVEAKNSAGSAFSNYDWGNRAVSLSLGSTTTSATASGGQKSVSVTANTSWSATKDVSWITLNTSSGSSSGTCSFTIAANSSDSSRTGYVIVTAGSGTSYPKTITNTVTQSGTSSTTYTITYMPGSNGTGLQQTATKTKDVALTLLGAIFTRTGYTQTGWATSDGGAKAYDLSASYSANAAATLFPHWTANTYTVTLDRQSGSGGTAVVTATYGQPMPSITIPARSGYTFGGYFTSTGGSGTQYYTASGASARTWDRASTTTLYAKWTQDPTSKPNLTFYKAKGWPAAAYLAKSSSSTTPATSFYQRETILLKLCYANFGDAAAGAHTIMAVLNNSSGREIRRWTWTQPSMAINACLGITDASFPAPSEGSYTMTITLDSTGVVTESDESDNICQLEFSTGTFEQSLGTALDNEALSFTTGGDASWFGQAATTHDGVDAAESGDISDNQNTWMQTTVSGFGVVSFWWNVSCESSDSTMWDYLEFLVDGTQKAIIGGTDGSWSQVSIPVAGKGSHTLKWNYHKDNSISNGSDCGWVDEVSWTAGQGVYFNANGGSCTTSLSVYVFGGKYSSLPTPSRPGYAFVGWYTSASGGTRITTSTAVTSAAARVLYAHWTPTTYTVAFSANGGNPPKGKKMAKQTLTYGKAANLRKNVFVRKGYVFAGWAVSAAHAKKGIVAYADAQSVKNLAAIGKTRVLYAVWAKETYTVVFYANGGKGKMAKQTFAYGKAKALSANKFTRKGYNFAGWALSAANAQRGIVKYKNKAKVKNLRKDGKAVKLYAVWQGTLSLDTALQPIGGTLKFTTGGASKWTVTSVSWNGSNSAIAGRSPGGGVSWLRTTVKGPGRVTFRWKGSGSPFEMCNFYVDGNYSAWIDGDNLSVDNIGPNYRVLDPDAKGWIATSTLVSGAGTHTLEWSYFHYEDEETSFFYLDEVVWTPVK